MKKILLWSLLLISCNVSHAIKKINRDSLLERQIDTVQSRVIGLYDKLQQVGSVKNFKDSSDIIKSQIDLIDSTFDSIYKNILKSGNSNSDFKRQLNIYYGLWRPFKSHVRDALKLTAVDLVEIRDIRNLLAQSESFRRITYDLPVFFYEDKSLISRKSVYIIDTVLTRTDIVLNRTDTVLTRTDTVLKRNDSIRKDIRSFQDTVLKLLSQQRDTRAALFAGAFNKGVYAIGLAYYFQPSKKGNYTVLLMAEWLPLINSVEYKKSGFSLMAGFRQRHLSLTLGPTFFEKGEYEDVSWKTTITYFPEKWGLGLGLGYSPLNGIGAYLHYAFRKPF